ncbi:neuronal acetylcholine receptor subunit alpha-10-like isoform X2 [Ptychodera flava]|uniref:neuronal acetylcholine receptor subunit alpha-10-like isoform X2 n=1 Tax=Ptychodera flava TaxID=63121 RepID=UPI00396A4E77
MSGNSLFSLVLFIAVLYQDCSGNETIKKLVKSLLEDYNTIVRPVHNMSTVTNVDMQLFISQVINMDERKQTLQVNTWLTLRWNDEYLQWDEAAYPGIRDIKLPSDLMWLPDVSLYDNAYEDYRNIMKGQIAVVYPNGDIMWAAPVILTSKCQIDVTYFPFDRQQCRMKFGPWQYEGTEVIMSGGGNTSVFKSDGEWEMEYLSSKANIEYYPDAPGIPYTDVTYTIYLRRRPIYYVFNLITPCGLFSLVTILSFLIPAESGEKITLGITVLLSLTVFLLLVAETTPPCSTIPLIGQYYAATMVMVTLSLGMSVTVLNLHYCGSERAPVPQKVRKLVFGHLEKILRVRSKYSTKCPPLNRYTTEAGICVVPRMLKELDCSWLKACALHSHCLRNKHMTNSHHSQAKNSRNDKQTNSNHDDHLLFHLLYEFRKIAQHCENRNKRETATNEWKRLAVVIDRLFMVFYVIGTICTILIIVCQIG